MNAYRRFKLAADPTYPLYPIASIITAVMLLHVLVTSLVRQSSNLGVAVLSFWLFLQNFTSGVNAIIWADNADVKFYAYCDIVSRVQIMTAVISPMASFIITRRLYMVASLQSAELPGKAKHRNLAIEWTLALFIPVLIAGPCYYVVQDARFSVLQGFGCGNALDNSILAILLVDSWSIVLPLISVVFYFPRIARIFYRQSRDIKQFLSDNGSESPMSRTNYYRILALASIDGLLNLPIGIMIIVLDVPGLVSQDSRPFYRGWTQEHSDWEPVGISLSQTLSKETSSVAQLYVVHWAPIVLASAIFGLFGVTTEARAVYWRGLCAVGGWCGLNLTKRTCQSLSSFLDTVEFSRQPMEVDIESNSSYISPSRHVHEEVMAIEDTRKVHNSVSRSDNGTDQDPRRNL